MENKYFMDCDCGYRVKGTSDAHAESNMKAHRLSNLHKRLMEMKNAKRKAD